jgi:ankyrin repeat protein
MIAAERGHLAVVQCLVEDLGADIDQAYNFGATALTGAAQRGHLAVVRCRVELGAEVGLADNNGYTALLLSADSGQYSTKQFLLEHASANVEEATTDGWTFWDHILILVKEDAEYEEQTAALIALLRVLVLRGALPPTL